MKKMLLFGMALLCFNFSAKPMHVFSLLNRPVLKTKHAVKCKMVRVTKKTHFHLLKGKEQ